MSKAPSTHSGGSSANGCEEEPAVRLLTLWKIRAQKSAEAHYKIASNRLSWNSILSSVAVVGSTALSATVVNNVDETIDEGLAWFLGLGSAVVAILAALHRTLAPGERGEQHRAAGAEWDKIFNDLCVRLATVDVKPPSPDDLVKVQEAMSDLVARSPSIPQGWFERVSLVTTYSQLSGDKDMLTGVRWWRRKRVRRG